MATASVPIHVISQVCHHLRHGEGLTIMAARWLTYACLGDIAAGFQKRRSSQEIAAAIRRDRWPMLKDAFRRDWNASDNTIP